MLKINQKNKGGAALEYVIVSLFATIIAISCGMFIKEVAISKVNALKTEAQISNEFNIGVSK